MKSAIKIFYTFLVFITILSCSKQNDAILDKNNQEAIKNAELLKALTVSKYYYYYKGERTPILVDENYIYMSLKDSNLLTSTIKFSDKEINASVYMRGKERKGGKPWAILQVNNLGLSFDSLAKELRLIDKSVHIAPVIGGEKKIGTSEFFYVKIREGDLSGLEKISQQYSCKIIKQVENMPRWFMLEAPTTSYGIEMANKFYESNLFDDIDPGFMFNFTANCTTDPMFTQQWGLQNSADIDINSCEAWNITRGDPSVLIAVIDQGIDQGHTEFANNYSSLSYDIVNNASPSVVYGDHGTHVGGIIGANQNNQQISGVAPMCTLMSISHSLYVSPTISSELASGISYAWQNGAGVISNSWGDQGGALYNYLHSAILESAIIDAINQGRNGLGSIVVFAAGNSGGNLDYPANFSPDILTVGSIDQSGAKSSFSAIGSQLDVVAPGGNILSTLTNNQTGAMSGTSMAAPHVSGLAGLILSISPSLTGLTIRNIIEANTKKIGNYMYTTTTGRPNGTWESNMGYGLIDAYAALQSLSGCQFITINNQTFTTSTSYTGCYITTNDITVSNNANLTLTGTQYVLINSPFTFNSGGELVIKNN